MKSEKIKVVKNWPKFKLVRNIQAFLDFANFYWQFIQGFNKIAAQLISMLKTTGSLDKPAFGKNNSSKSAFRRNNSNGKFDGFGGNSVEY